MWQRINEVNITDTLKRNVMFESRIDNKLSIIYNLTTQKNFTPEILKLFPPSDTWPRAIAWINKK